MRRNLTVESSLEILETIGMHLKELRKAKGYTNHQDFANDHDLPTIQYWRMEKGVANFTVRSLARVLAAHGMTVAEFFALVLERKSFKRNQ